MWMKLAGSAVISGDVQGDDCWSPFSCKRYSSDPYESFQSFHFSRTKNNLNQTFSCHTYANIFLSEGPKQRDAQIREQYIILVANSLFCSNFSEIRWTDVLSWAWEDADATTVKTNKKLHVNTLLFSKDLKYWRQKRVKNEFRWRRWNMASEQSWK